MTAISEIRPSSALTSDGPHLGRPARLDWADVAKGIGMILVFEGHVLEVMIGSGGLIEKSNQWIYSFHMPLFFLLSGFLASSKPFVLSRKVSSRLIPYLFFNLTSFVLMVVIEGLHHRLRPGFYVFSLAVMSRGYPIFNFPVWFLASLLVVELIDHGLRRILKSSGLVFLASWLVFGLGYVITRKEKFFIDATGLGEGYWYLKQSFLILPFYECGVLLKRVKSPRPTPGWVWFVTFAASGGLLLVLFDRNPTINLSVARIGNPVLMLANGLLGTAMIIALARLIPSNDVLSFLGRNTLPLLGLDGIFMQFINPAIGRFILEATTDPWASLALSVLATALSLLASIPFLFLLDQYLPQAIGKPAHR